MSRKVMQQALDFCVFCWRDVDMNDYAFERLETTIDALRTELAKPEQEPACWVDAKALRRMHNFDATAYGRSGFDDAVPLFTKEQL